MSPAEIDLRRLYGPTAKIGSGDLIRMRTAHGEGLLSALAQQRQMSAYQQAQIQQRKQEHDQDLLQAAIKDPRQLEALAEMPDYSLSKQAKMISKSFKDADYMSFPAYQKVIEDMDPGFTQRFLAGQVDYYDFQAHLDEARNFTKEEAKAKAKSSIIQRALDTPADQRSAYQKQLVEEHEATVGVKNADIELKQAQAELARHKATMPEGTDHSVLGRIHQKVSGGLPWEQGTQQTQAQALKEYSHMYAQARMDVQLGTPPPLTQQSNYYPIDSLKRLSLDQTGIKGKSEGELRSGPYRQLDDKEKDAVVQYNVAEKTVETMNRVASSLITAKSPKQAFKQKIALEAGAFSGNNPLAKAYKADLDSVSSRMARLVEVGVLTNTDVTRWSQTFGSFGDTVGALHAKQALFAEIQNETRRLLAERISGVPSEKLNRSKLDKLLEQADRHTSVDRDWETLTQ